MCHALTRTELSVLRHLLEDFLSGATGAIQLSEGVNGDGAALLANARSLRLEGIVAKHRDRPHRSGRTGDCLKIKCVQSESFIIVGYEQSTSARSGIGSLLLAGHAGKLRTRQPAVPLKGRNLVFTHPTLIVEIEYRGWIHDGNLRHASYKGLREVQDNAAVFDMSKKPDG